MRIFEEPINPGIVWNWGENFLFSTLMIFTFGMAFRYYRDAISREFHWTFFGGIWVFICVNLVFFIPAFLLFPISIPALAIFTHWNQTKDAREIFIDALRSK
jgi:hypothetical protein